MPETFETGEFALVADTRRLRGLITPYGETGQNAAGEFVFSAGSVSLPTDGIDLWIGHEHKTHLGRTVALDETENGVVAEFEIDPGLVGDRFLAEYAKGKKHNLSAEFSRIVRDGSRVVESALSGVAAVVLGGFESAAFFELAEADLAADLAPRSTDPFVEAVSEWASTYSNQSVSQADIDAAIAAAEHAISEALATKTADDSAESEDTTETPTEKESPMATATVPNTLAVEPVETDEDLSAAGVFELITKVAKGSLDAEAAVFALADIKTSGSGALSATGVIQPAWLGEVWAEKSYERRYFPLVKNGSITNQDEKGFLMSGAELMQAYSGNKADVPTGTATTSLVSSTFQRWAVAVDIAREFYDIPGNTDVIEAFVRRIFNSYARVTDKWALQQYIAAAGTAVAADTFPSGYSASIGKLLQGIDLINDSDVDATFAVVAPDVFKGLLYTPKDQIPEFVSLSITGDLSTGAAGGVTVLRDKFGVLSAGQVLVGSHDAAHVNELSGASPLIVDALDVSRGGLDKGAHGYTQYLTEYSNGFKLVGVAA